MTLGVIYINVLPLYGFQGWLLESVDMGDICVKVCFRLATETILKIKN